MTTGRYAPGHVIAGRYRLDTLLGEGGMGAVWRAEHLTLKSPVAVKFISPAQAFNEDLVARFMLEAQSAAALRSTHIVQVFDFGLEDGTPYIAMELLSGESLSDRLEREGRLSPSGIAKILAETARAIDYAHGRGILHRDLKPDNVFIVREGQVEVTKVLDFGIAKVTETADVPSTGSKTATGVLLGTPYYISPEAARGHRAVDYRSDLWALGVIVYECVVGLKPFDSEGLGDLLVKICSESHPTPSEHAQVPQGFNEWAARALAKDPAARFPSAAAMSEAFSMLVSQPSILEGSLARAENAKAGPAPHDPIPQGTTNRAFSRSSTAQIGAPRRRWLPVALAAGGVALLAAGAATWLLRGKDHVSAAAPTSSTASAGLQPSSRPPLPPPQAVANPPVQPAPTVIAARQTVVDAGGNDREGATDAGTERVSTAASGAEQPTSRPARVVLQARRRALEPVVPGTAPDPPPPEPRPKASGSESPAPRQGGAALFDDRK